MSDTSIHIPPVVFVVDDDANMRRATCALFESASLAVKPFDSGLSFLERYTHDAPGCIVMDVRLPDLSGLQVLERLRATLGYCPKTIFMSGYSDVATAVAAMKLGALDFLQKPFSPQYLLDLAQSAIAADRLEHTRRRDTRAAMESLVLLTERERHILRDLFHGKPNKRIAAEAQLSEKTVAAHRANILRKVGADSLIELIHILVACGWNT